MAEMRALAQSDREAFIDLIAACYFDPELFFTEVLQVNDSQDPPQRLRRWQQKACAEIKAKLEAGEKHVKVLIRSCHGAGKTFFAGGILLWFMVTRYQSRGLTLAQSWAGVEGLLWPEIAKLYGQSLLSRLSFGRLLDTKLLLDEKTWFAIGTSSDRPAKLEGHHSPTAAIRIVDEAKEVDPPMIESTEGTLDAPETLDLWISTPSIEAGDFYERDMSSDTSVIRLVVDVDELIDDGVVGKAEWKAERGQDPPIGWGVESATYQMRVMARYADNAEGALFPSSWVERAMGHDWELSAAAPHLVGMDVAGSVDGDENAVAVAAGPGTPMGEPNLGERWTVPSLTAWHERDTMLSKGRALAIARDARAPLRIDSNGLGKGVFDSAHQSGYPVQEYRASDKAKHPDRFVNRKAEDCWLVRGMLEKDLIAFGRGWSPAMRQKFKSQMRAMKYKPEQSGKFRVIDPPDSPDLVDAIVIALAPARVGYRAVSPAWL